MPQSLKENLISQLKQGFIVSCQALENEPLHGPQHMQKMALAAIEGGADALRMNSALDIKAARQVTALPIIGLVKKNYDGSDIFITPTKAEIDEIASSGAEIVAIDMTSRLRPTTDSLKQLVDYAHGKGLLVMADLAQYSDAQMAAEAGADFLGTTLAGYTQETKAKRSLPDFDFMEALIQNYDIPIIAEGGIASPEQAVKALQMGCHSVVVGSAITRPQLIAQSYGQKIQNWRQKQNSHILAVDLGGTHIRFAVINAQGDMAQRSMLKTADYASADDIALASVKHMEFIIENSPLNISAISIATAGQINISTGAVIQASATIKNWAHINLKSLTESHMAKPCFIDNDANLALWGEYHYGAAQNKHHVVMLTLGTGLGGAMILDGKLHHGHGYLAANWGQNLVYDSIKGDYTYLENIVSGTGLQNLALALQCPHHKGKEIIATALKGEKQAQKALGIFAEYLARLIHNINLSVNPEVIIIGGGMSDNFNDWRPFLDKALEAYPLSAPIKAAQLKADAGLLGAAALGFGL